MGVGTFRQEVLNVVLAELLEKRGIVALPEIRLARKAPDILVSFYGLRLAIEGEISDQTDAKREAWRKAQERVRNNIANFGLALVYPAKLTKVASLDRLRQELAECPLRFSLCPPSLPETAQWQEGSLDTLCAALNAAYQHLASEDEVQKAAKLLREGIDVLANDLLALGATPERMAVPLGIAILEDAQKRRVDIAKIAALIVANALLFQGELARVDHKVKTLHQCMDAKSPHDELLEVWQFILDEINYHAVFDIARSILLTLPTDKRLDEAIKRCAEKVLQVVRMRAALQHDLVGRLYHLLLGDIAKPLGTYYTSVASATLLLRLALDPKRWDIQWHDPHSLSKLRIADLACGTGTLLMAALQSVVDNFMRAASQQQRLEDLTKQRTYSLKALLEKGFWGLDVLQSAVHLTATTLALPIPEVKVKGMNLYAMDLGVDRKSKVVHLGSLDLLSKEPPTAVLSLFPVKGGKRITDTSPSRVTINLPFMDLICMNPPFTRTCGDNLLFGSLPNEERKQLQKALQSLIQKEKLKASVTAGLGSVFLALADRYLKPNGRLAFVLPKALLSGVEWQQSRELLAKDYIVETIIVSHDPNRWNFSENTDLSEVLLIARKLTRPKPFRPPKEPTLCVNLWRNPDKPLDALMLAEGLRANNVPPLSEGKFSLWLGSEKVGEAFTVRWDKLCQLHHWLFPFAFAQTELVQVLWALQYQHNLQSITIPLCPLDELGALGPSGNDLWDAFDPVDHPPGYPALWGHKATEMTTMVQCPNAYLVKITMPRRPGRSLRNAESLWQRASQLLIAGRMWLNTQRLLAILLSEPVLSNVWLPLKLKSNCDAESMKAVALWFNSTPGILILIGHRIETRGAWVAFLRRALQTLPVLDVRRLTQQQLKHLADPFDRLSEQPLQPLSQLADDPVRKAIDDAISEVLGLPDLTPLRLQLAREPILTLKPLRQQLFTGSQLARK
ncbi:MAG: N-6 DNA methylase [Armatimonadetes bacterium]|nr:N-6 DNA methylase [Armatimonadota bacterium]